MIPITKKTNRLRLILLSLALAVLGLIAYRAFVYTPAETLNVKTFRVSGGWGYQVYIHQKLYIDQPFIPCITGRKPFPNRKTALRAAKTVKAKMLHGQIPNLTLDDILKTGVDNMGNLK